MTEATLVTSLVLVLEDVDLRALALLDNFSGDGDLLEVCGLRLDGCAIDEQNRASTRQAIIYAASTIAITAIVAFVVALIARMSGGPLCEAGEATWLCTESWRTTWAIVASIPPVVGLLGCAIIMVRKLNRYQRWVPWMGVFWLPLVPLTMAWLIVTVGILAQDSAPQ